jgi:hypothetical protein
MVRLADYLDVWIVEAPPPLAINVDFGIGVEWPAGFSFEQVPEAQKAISSDHIVSKG